MADTPYPSNTVIGRDKRLEFTATLLSDTVKMHKDGMIRKPQELIDALVTVATFLQSVIEESKKMTESTED